MAKFGIGQAVRRVEDPRLLTGGGRYTDDTKAGVGVARGYVLRSPHAHAKIRSIGTTAAKTAPGVLAVLDKLQPTRIGHGIAAAASEEAVRKLAEAGTVLEICPSSNLRTHALPDLEALGAALRTFEAGGVRYTINTDGPYLLQTHLRYEYQMLLDAGILTEAQVERVNAVARAAALLAVAGLGVVLVARFNHVLDAALARMVLPEGVVVLVDQEREKLAGADLTTVPPALQGALRRAFDDAYVAGFRTLMLTAAALAASGALAALWLVEPRRAQAPDRQPPPSA